MKRLVAGATALVPRVEGLEVQCIDRLTDEVRQMPFGQPVLQRGGQQHFLLRFVEVIALPQSTCPTLASLSGTSLLPPTRLERPCRLKLDGKRGCSLAHRPRHLLSVTLNFVLPRPLRNSP